MNFKTTVTNSYCSLS